MKLATRHAIEVERNERVFSWTSIRATTYLLACMRRIYTYLAPHYYFFFSPSSSPMNIVSCALHNSLYKPPRSMSFSCVPLSATFPSFSTMTTSES
jgi:hypothetical protein